MLKRLRAEAARLIKRQLPTSLFGRTLLIIVLPVALMQAAVTFFFFDAHWQAVTSRLSQGLAGEVALISREYQADPSPEGLLRIQDQARTLSLSVDFRPEGLPATLRPAFFAPVDRALNTALAEHLSQPYWFDTTRYPDYVDIRVAQDGGRLQIIAPRERAFAASGGIFLLWMAVATVLLLAVAIGFIRNQVRAIERLAEAAEDFGRGVESDFKPHGAREVRQAARAFLAMKTRIQRHIDQRTALLASVSHDLRTPLTRLKLEMALAEPSERTAAMKRDLSDMEHMIDEYLAFARGEAGEAAERVRIGPLIGAIADDARRGGASVELNLEQDFAVTLRPSAIKRALSNLVANAAAHGERIEITARRTPSGGAEIEIDDDGPGIAPEHYEDAMRPFGRLDTARNQNAKGVGLGLAIARDIVRGHGGELSLSSSPLGGLRVLVRLPG